MELKWLDDYIALIEAGSFSAAAERRHLSQPAFSRRIQMLEAWLGVALIERTRKPLQLTTVAIEHQAAFRSLVARIYEFRAMLKAEALDSAGLTIAAQHTLAASYVPSFLAWLRHLQPEQNFRIHSESWLATKARASHLYLSRCAATYLVVGGYAAAEHATARMSTGPSP